MRLPAPVDLAVIGGGPAGWSVSRRAAAAGLRTAVIDPTHGQAWSQTFGIWADELPAWLPQDVVRSRMSTPSAITTRRHRITRAYAMLSTPRLQAALTAGHEHIAVHDRPAISTRPGRGGGSPTEVLLDGGGSLTARVVVDCSGSRRVVSGGPARGVRAAQTAFGVVVPDQDAIEPAFMDWRDDHGHAGWPTFLYAVPLGADADGVGQVLLEETSLARRPGLDPAVLERRLHDRLAARGIHVPAGAPTETVSFVVDTPPAAGTGGVVPFGAAAPTLHPATGYSLGATLGLVDDLVAAVAEQLPDGPAAVRSARAVVWSPAARLVHHLRRRGLEAVLALPPEGVVDFFDIFFSLPAEAQRVYLSGRADPVALARVMWQVFTLSDTRLRRHLLRWGVAPTGDHRVTTPRR